MNIAIAGYGMEGESNYRYFLNTGHSVTIVDEQNLPSRPLPSNALTLLGPDTFKKLRNFDLVVRTAGLAPHKIETDGKIWSATNEFFAQCPAPIIGVTGTKGKGTTCSLIAHILEAAGLNVWLVGNIGKPALDILDQIQTQDIVVYELSSFQLWDIEKSPHIAVVTIIEADHLDVHKDMDEYVSAKGNIARFQTKNDTVIVNASNIYSRSIAELSAGTHVFYPDQTTIYEADGYFWHNETKICSVGNLKLPGVHNIENACAAIAATWEYIQDGEVIARGLSTFEGLPHRLKLVGEHKGVTFYDDSIATTPGSAIAALKAFSQPKIMILGGSSKGADFSELAQLFSHTTTLKKVFLIGQEASTIAKAFDQTGFKNFEDLGSDISMKDIVTKAHQAAQSGDAVILSPSCASFGMFKDYKDRGDQFIAAVQAL